MTWPDEYSTSVLPYATHKNRIRYTHTFRSGWESRTTADIARYTEKHFPPETGYMLSQNIGYRGKGPFTGDLYLAFFNAESYDVRLYSYEKNLLTLSTCLPFTDRAAGQQFRLNMRPPLHSPSH